MPRSHIVAAAEIVRELNSRLNAPQVISLTESTSSELDGIIERHVAEALTKLGIDDVDTAMAVKNAVTLALYVKLEDLLVMLDKANVKLATQHQ